jgi:hypothetical protein
MDPTKSFDHLDPKLKETYARVMGTNTNGSGTPTQNTPAPAPSTPAPGGLSASPYSPADPSQPAADPAQTQNQFGPAANPTPMMNTGPNPGTGPTINTMPDATQQSFTPPATEPPSTAVPEPSSPPNNAFFSNPAPDADPTAMSEQAAPSPDESGPGSTPITPYASPEDFSASQVAAPDQMTQPLPSPASVNQSAPHETSPLLKVLYIVGSVIFFAIYTLFWIKIFGLPLPFPLPF